MEEQAHPGASVPGSARSALSRFAPTKIFVLNVSEVAAQLGLPTCSEDLFVTDPEALIVLPNPALVPNFTTDPPPPPPGHEWIYPYASSPHYTSQNAGPWCACAHGTTSTEPAQRALGRVPEADDAQRPRGRRYVLQTLRNSGSSVDTIDEADVVYVYDYCYHMRALADDHARRHWWLKDQYYPERTVGKHLMSCYRRGLTAAATLPPLAMFRACPGMCLHASAQGHDGVAALAALWRRRLCVLPRAPWLYVG